MKTSVLTLVLLLICSQFFAQNSNDPIRMEKKKIYQNDVLLKYKDLKQILMNESRSAAEFKTFKVNQTIGSACLLTGCGLTLVGAILMFSESKKELDATNEGDLNYKGDYSASTAAAGIGLACVIVSIPFSIKSKKSLRKSIDLYNSGLKDTGNSDVDFKLNLGYNQVGFTMKF